MLVSSGVEENTKLVKAVFRLNQRFGFILRKRQSLAQKQFVWILLPKIMLRLSFMTDLDMRRLGVPIGVRANFILWKNIYRRVLC